jgi:hypothetical protein
MIELNNQALSMLDKKYNLLLKIDARQFDNNWQLLSDKLDSIKKESFLPNDRILIAHMDTDYYDELLPCGLIIINLVRMFKNKDIPLYLLLLVTNHYGINKEFDLLLVDHHKKDRPTIIETLLSQLLLSNNFVLEDDCRIDQIEKAAMSMIGRQRSHRVALCNFIADSNLLNQVALQTNFLK